MTTYPNKFCIVVHTQALQHCYTTYWKSCETKQELEDYLDELSDMGYVIGDIYNEEQMKR